jgi:hypothetical protein
LLEARIILPILDGFDELPAGVRGRAISEINDQLRPGERFIMTSRTEEYHTATHPVSGPEITLAAAAIELLPLGIADVTTYLRQAAGGPRSAARWDPVFAELARSGALALVFSNPLMVGLARIIYNPRPGEFPGTLPDPADLCLLSGKEAIEGHLLDGFIPAAYRYGHPGWNAGHRWTAKQAEKWHTFLACHLERVVGKPSFAWWDLKAAAPAVTYLASGAIAGAAAGIPLILITALYVVIVALETRTSGSSR